MNDDGTPLQQLNRPSARSPASAAAIVCGGLLLAGIAVSRVLKSSTSGRTGERTKRYEQADPAPDPELGAWG